MAVGQRPGFTAPKCRKPCKGGTIDGQSLETAIPRRLVLFNRHLDGLLRLLQECVGFAAGVVGQEERQAQLREQQFARNSLGCQDGEAGGADVRGLFRLHQSRQAA